MIRAPLSKGKGQGSFEHYVNRGIARGYRIFGEIQYETVKGQTICTCAMIKMIKADE